MAERENAHLKSKSAEKRKTESIRYPKITFESSLANLFFIALIFFIIRRPSYINLENAEGEDKEEQNCLSHNS